MIIHYLKDTGRIIGVTHGRVHTQDELSMDIVPGDGGEVDKFIVPTKIHPETKEARFEKQIYHKIEDKKAYVFDYKMNDDRDGIRKKH